MSERGVRFRSVVSDGVLREFFGDAVVGVERMALMSVVTVRSEVDGLELERRFAEWFAERERVENEGQEAEDARRYDERRRQQIGKKLEGYEWFDKKWREPDPFTCALLWGYSYLATQRRKPVLM